MNNYALILAGGSGTRFWPLSRNERPKQLIDLFGEGSLLRQSIDRLDGIIDKTHIFILTNAIQQEEVRRQAHDIPTANIIAEPVRRDTAPAIALGIGLIAANDPEASMLVIPSDQLIHQSDAFQQLMRDALLMTREEKALFTIGIKPTWPCPSYGYIELGSPITHASITHTCNEVLQFREKPDMDTARNYLQQGNYSWNAGMFVWSLPTVRQELANHCPQLADFITGISTAKNTAQYLEENFPKLTPISIDFALMEKAARILTFEASFDWDDIGSWISVAHYLSSIEGNASNTPMTTLDSTGNIAYTTHHGKHIALLGIKDAIIVDTDDALLVADKTRADDIKKIVSLLPKQLI
ncbi:MAG: mannose-1-phosphate guanylyltransferase [Akkermansia sp.]